MALPGEPTSGLGQVARRSAPALSSCVGWTRARDGTFTQTSRCVGMKGRATGSRRYGRATALAVGLAACTACGAGGADPAAPSAPGIEGSAEPDGGAPEQAPPPSSVAQTEALIGELLMGVDGAEDSAQAASTERIFPPRNDEPGDVRLDTFEEDVARIRQEVPRWDNGTGVTVKYLKEATGKRLSLIYVDPNAPTRNERLGLWAMRLQARVGGRTIGHVLMLIRTLAPGRYEGSPGSKDVVLAVSMAEDWEGTDPETTWSVNPGSWAEITLRPGRFPGDLEGDFRAKLVDNRGTGFHTIEAGYVYINR